MTSSGASCGGPLIAVRSPLVRELEARRVLRDHLTTLALGGNHPAAVIVPREAVEALLAHRCDAHRSGDVVAILPEGDVVGPFTSLAEADAWASAQPDGETIVKTSIRCPEATYPARPCVEADRAR